MPQPRLIAISGSCAIRGDTVRQGTAGLGNAAGSLRTRSVHRRSQYNPCPWPRTSVIFCGSASAIIPPCSPVPFGNAANRAASRRRQSNIPKNRHSPAGASTMPGRKLGCDGGAAHIVSCRNRHGIRIVRRRIGASRLPLYNFRGRKNCFLSRLLLLSVAGAYSKR